MTDLSLRPQPSVTVELVIKVKGREHATISLSEALRFMSVALTESGNDPVAAEAALKQAVEKQLFRL